MGIDTTLMLGRVAEHNEHRIQDIIKEYQPFVKEFSTWHSFRMWQREAKRPLMKDKYLAVIKDEVFRPRLNSMIMETQEMNNPHVKLLMVITPRERMYNMEFHQIENLEVIDLNVTAREDFAEMISRELAPIEEEAVEYLIRKIGLSYQTYILYRKDLLALETRDKAAIRDTITEKKLPPVEWILLGVLERDKRAIRNHIELCKKYSESWVLNHYRSTLGLVIWLKDRVHEGDMTLIRIRTNEKFSRVLPLVRDAKIADVFLLKKYIENKRFPIEEWVLTEHSGEILKYNLEELESHTLLNKKQNKLGFEPDKGLYWTPKTSSY